MADDFDEIVDSALRRHDERLATRAKVPCARCGARPVAAPGAGPVGPDAKLAIMCAPCAERGPLSPEEAARWRARLAEDAPGRYEVVVVYPDGNPETVSRHAELDAALAERERVRAGLLGRGYGRSNSFVGVADSEDGERWLDYEDADA